MTALEAAIDYMHRGWVPIPLCWPDTRGSCACGQNHQGGDIGKAPLLGKGYQAIQPTEAEVRRWWRRWPKANVGLLLAPSGLLVIDTDSENALEEALGRGLPPAPVAETGKGWHYYYRANGVAGRSTKQGEHHTPDVLALGYVVAPPSHHREGRQYAWALGPNDAELQEAPAWAVAMLGKPDPQPTTLDVDEDSPLVRLDEMGAEVWAGRAAVDKGDGKLKRIDELAEIDRSETLYALGCRLAKAGATSGSIGKALAERDRALGLHKYSDRPDGGAVEYSRIAKKALDEWDKEQRGPRLIVHPAQPGGSISPPEWEAPTPFFQGDVPAFPSEVFPSWLRAYVEAEAVATQTPIDLAGTLALAALSTAVAKKVAVRVRDGWQEPVNVYTVTALPPGNRKSAVFSDVAGPIEEHERSEAERLAPQIAEAESRYRVAKSRLEHVQAQAARAKPDEAAALANESVNLARELAAMDVPAMPRLIVDDCTPEKLSTLLRDQGGRLAVLSAEGDVFDLMAGRYSERGANFGVFLRGHAGDNLRVDRVGRPPEFVKAPALTMGLAVQPEVVRGLVKQPGFRGRGLLGRFLYSWPRSPLGHRKVDAPPLPEATRASYHRGIQALLELPFGTDERGESAPHVLMLDAEANVLLLDFMRWLEPQLDEFGDMANIDDWASKLAGAVVRVAGLLHVAHHHADPAPWRYPIARTTMAAAIQLGYYLIDHARLAFFEMGADGEAEKARYILRWIDRAAVAAFTKRQCFDATKGHFKRVEAMEPALKLLEAHGYIRALPTDDRQGPGRKPSPVYEVNPLINSANCANSAKACGCPESADSANTGLDPHLEAHTRLGGAPRVNGAGHSHNSQYSQNSDNQDDEDVWTSLIASEAPAANGNIGKV